MAIAVWLCQHCRRQHLSEEAAEKCEQTHIARCECCGVIFVKRVKSQKHCSSMCRERAKSERRKERENGSNSKTK